MHNPWPESTDWQQPYILAEDQGRVKAFNANCAKDVEIQTASFPQPYIGDPARARVVFLALNPGHSEVKPVDHVGDNTFLDTMRLSLRHQIDDYPFYPLNPQFKDTLAAKWWLKRTRPLVTAGISIETLAVKLMVIEWFPYHSKRFARMPEILPSQQYTFHLAKRMHAEGKLFVRMRSRAAWTDVHPPFEHVHALKNPRCAHISSRNSSEAIFNAIVAALK